jgi:hypothetical protein
MKNQYDFYFYFQKLDNPICFTLNGKSTEFVKEYVCLFIYFWKCLEPFGKRRENLNLELKLNLG